MEEITTEEFGIFHKLDSLCKAENKIGNNKEEIDNSDDSVSNKSAADHWKKTTPPLGEMFDQKSAESSTSSKSVKKGKGKLGIGKGWFWTSLGVGGYIFAGSAVIMSSINDECTPILITDLSKTDEQCKEDAKQQRQIAGLGMMLGVLLSLVGIIGLSGPSN